MTSKRKQKIETVLDELFHPTFQVIEYNYSEYRYAVVETPKLNAMPDDKSPVTMTRIFREEFHDKSTAVFCANMKRAEAILAALEAIQ